MSTTAISTETVRIEFRIRREHYPYFKRVAEMMFAEPTETGQKVINEPKVSALAQTALSVFANEYLKKKYGVTGGNGKAELEQEDVSDLVL